MHSFIQLAQELEGFCANPSEFSPLSQLLPCIPLKVAMWGSRALFALAHLVYLTNGANPPSGFPASGNGLWFTQPGNVWSREWLPVGNGYLAAMLSGGTLQEVTQLNIESLWSGGPFVDPTYNGGNKQPSEQATTAAEMQNIRQSIFQSPTGDIDNIEQLATDPGQYGSYAGAGYLLANANLTGPITNYARWLDLDQAIARTTWSQSGASYDRTTFCSHPTQSCTQHLSSTSTLPALSFTFSSEQESGLPAPNITCQSSTILRVRGFVSPPPSMLYEFLFQLSIPSSPGAGSSSNSIQCLQLPVTSGSPPNATLQFTPSVKSSAKEAWITWVGSTQYSIDAGDPAHNFSFLGADPHASLVALLSSQHLSSSTPFASLLKTHTTDFQSTVTTPFSLSLGQTPQNIPTDQLKNAYTIDASGNAEGNRYLEWVLFNYGRYLLASSARGVLPANLQGKWADGQGNAWSADYHSNINIQMNYWSAEMTNLDVSTSLFDYIQKTWAPRGEYTANVLYNISRGWVTHDEMNIFGHTGMKAYMNSAEWANYPESNAWMMLHVWDHFDYTNDIAWWKAQGWPLLKGVASFHLEKLIPDLYFNDSTLVVNPCNSPEQAPITFGCAHAQQLIWQLFNAVEKGFDASGDTDSAFLDEIRTKRAKMDKGLHIGSWGQLQEWKVDQDSPTDTHRHLSHLIGLYPGYAVTNYDPLLQSQPSKAYTKDQIIDAATISLIHRGNGTGPDADSGWEKAWRAAAWAQLGNSSMFYHELSYAIFENFAPNLFSLYNPFDLVDPIFQIDANLGFPAAVMNALLQAPDVPDRTADLNVVLLPALPSHWPSGSISGARIRGGITVDIRWSNGKLAAASFKADTTVVARPVKVMYKDIIVAQFVTSSGFSRSISGF